jgi:Ecdysteroid kinase-like family
MADAGATLVDCNSEFINQYVLASENSVEKEQRNLVDESEIPEWLKNDLLEDALRKHLKNPLIVVKKLKIMFCGGKGDSYASIMYRVLTYYCDQRYPEMVKCVSCILKTIPQNELALENLGSRNYDVQNKEMFFYEKLIPEFERILSAIGENGSTFPTIMAVYRDLNLIVMEDLMELNFIMRNRLEGLDTVHAKESLKTLAKIHAASVILYEKDPKIFDNMDTGFYTRKTDVFKVFFCSNLDVFTNTVATWNDWKNSEYYVEKLRKLRKNFFENCRKAFDRNDSDFNCFNHGDLWTNNVLFRYNDDACDRPASTVILDYQYYFYGSPALDLIVSGQNFFEIKKKTYIFFSIFCTLLSTTKCAWKIWKN